jgi:hypothetical protein
VLLDQGFTDLDPSHPLGGPDGKADALAHHNGKQSVMAVYFPLGQQAFTETKKKFVDDSKGVKQNGADAFTFVTNQELTRSERKALANTVAFPVKIFHLERVVAVLDQPRMQSVREQYLGIAAPGGVLSREQRIAELWRASVARCAARWQGIGLPKDEARALAQNRSIGAVDASNYPSPDERLVVWTAPFGSGKSIASERYHQDGLEAARDDESTPAPVFLRASACIPSLADAVEAAAQAVAAVRRVGARVVIDAIDEVGHQVADELLMQARVLVEMWPSTTVLMTSRAVPALMEAPERKALSPLTKAEQETCVQLGLGAADDHIGTRLHGLPQPVRATLGQPFFALLVGLWMRNRVGLPGAPIELMSMLGEKATRGLAIDQRHLRALAVRSVARELGPVPAGDVLEGLRPDDLLATGMLEQQHGGLVFILPAVAQWFAAQALLFAEVPVERLLAAPEDLELWVYPLALAVSLGSANQAKELLGPLLCQEPGYAFRVLTATFGLALVGGSEPPPWREAGTQAREALQALSDAIGPFSQLVCDVDASGHLLPMAVATDQRHFTVAFWKGQEHRDDIFPLPSGFNLVNAGPGWDRVRSGGVGPGAAWAWPWASSTLRYSVDALLKSRAFPVPADSPLGMEATWAAACDLTRKGRLLTGGIELAELEALLGQVPQERWSGGQVRWQKGNAIHDLRGLRQCVTTARTRGEIELTPPVPPADVVPEGPGASAWVGDFYSDERLVEAATAVYQLAIVAYRDITERWMPSLLLQLEHYVLMPTRLVGFVSTGRGSPGGMVLPTLGGYFEALPQKSESEVCITLTKDGYDFSAGDAGFRQQRAARPRAARWLSGGHGGMPLDLGQVEPIADVVYDWIAHDLVRLGLATSGARARSGKRFVRFYF